MREPSERLVVGVCKRSPGWATLETGCCVDALPRVSCSRLTTHLRTLIRGYHQTHHMRLHRRIVRLAPTECTRRKRTTRQNCSRLRPVDSEREARTAAKVRTASVRAARGCERHGCLAPARTSRLPAHVLIPRPAAGIRSAVTAGAA